MRSKPEEHVILTHGPVVRGESCDLVRIVDMDGYGDLRIMRFRRDILWIRETETWMECINPRHVSSEMNDFHGFMTSMDKLLPSSIEYSETHPTSTISVITRVTDYPCVEFTQTSSHLYPPEWLDLTGRSAYLRVREDWGLNDEKVETVLTKDREEGEAYDLTHLMPIETEMTIWSSLHSSALNAHLLKSLESYRP